MEHKITGIDAGASHRFNHIPMSVLHEKLRVEQEKFEQEKELQNKKLSSVLLDSKRKKEVLVEIKQKLTELKVEKPEDKENLRKIQMLIKQNILFDSHWDRFSEHYSAVHQNFFENLRDRFPDLSAHETRLCSFIKMNMNNQEMANMLNISLAGVQKARVRLRRKLSLKRREDLFHFIAGIG